MLEVKDRSAVQSICRARKAESDVWAQQLERVAEYESASGRSGVQAQVVFVSKAGSVSVV